MLNIPNKSLATGQDADGLELSLNFEILLTVRLSKKSNRLGLKRIIHSGKIVKMDRASLHFHQRSYHLAGFDTSMTVQLNWTLSFTTMVLCKFSFVSGLYLWLTCGRYWRRDWSSRRWTNHRRCRPWTTSPLFVWTQLLHEKFNHKPRSAEGQPYLLLRRTSRHFRWDEVTRFEACFGQLSLDAI